MRPLLSSVRPETGHAAVASSKKPWLMALAGLLLLAVAAALMAIGAPAHAQTSPHYRQAQPAIAGQN
jgi:hypothetical protein